MSQKLILENRSTMSLEEAQRILDDFDDTLQSSHGATANYEDGRLFATVYQNKSSTRVVFHHNDGVDHQVRAEGDAIEMPASEPGRPGRKAP